MKQNELARIAGCTPQHISDIKNGKKNVSRKLAEKLEEATGISIMDWLFPTRAETNPWNNIDSIEPLNKQ